MSLTDEAAMAAKKLEAYVEDSEAKLEKAKENNILTPDERINIDETNKELKQAKKELNELTKKSFSLKNGAQIYYTGEVGDKGVQVLDGKERQAIIDKADKSLAGADFKLNNESRDKVEVLQIERKGKTYVQFVRSELDANDKRETQISKLISVEELKNDTLKDQLSTVKSYTDGADEVEEKSGAGNKLIIDKNAAKKEQSDATTPSTEKSSTGSARADHYNKNETKKQTSADDKKMKAQAELLKTYKGYNETIAERNQRFDQMELEVKDKAGTDTEKALVKSETFDYRLSKKEGEPTKQTMTVGSAKKYYLALKLQSNNELYKLQAQDWNKHIFNEIKDKPNDHILTMTNVPKELEVSQYGPMGNEAKVSFIDSKVEVNTNTKDIKKILNKDGTINTKEVFDPETHSIKKEYRDEVAGLSALYFGTEVYDSDNWAASKADGFRQNFFIDNIAGKNNNPNSPETYNSAGFNLHIQNHLRKNAEVRELATQA